MVRAGREGGIGQGQEKARKQEKKTMYLHKQDAGGSFPDKDIKSGPNA